MLCGNRLLKSRIFIGVSTLQCLCCCNEGQTNTKMLEILRRFVLELYTCGPGLSILRSASGDWTRKIHGTRDAVVDVYCMKFHLTGARYLPCHSDKLTDNQASMNRLFVRTITAWYRPVLVSYLVPVTCMNLSYSITQLPAAAAHLQQFLRFFISRQKYPLSNTTFNNG